MSRAGDAVWDSDAVLHRTAELTIGYSGAELANLLNEAAILMVRRLPVFNLLLRLSACHPAETALAGVILMSCILDMDHVCSAISNSCLWDPCSGRQLVLVRSFGSLK